MLDAELPMLRRRLKRLRRRLNQLAPAFAAEPEWHAIDLAGGLSDAARKRNTRRGLPSLENFQREFVYRTALRAMAAEPAAFVYTMHWTWSASAPPSSKTSDYLSLAGVLEWVDEHGYPLNRVCCDVGREAGYHRAMEEAQVRRVEKWAQPRFVDSKEDRLVQMADLASYAAFQDVTRSRAGNKAHMVDWYRHDCASSWAHDGDGHGYRRYQGKNCDPK